MGIRFIVALISVAIGLGLFGGMKEFNCPYCGSKVSEFGFKDSTKCKRCEEIILLKWKQRKKEGKREKLASSEVQTVKGEYHEGDTNQYASWAIGIAFMFISVGAFFDNIFGGIIIWMGCLILLPPISQRISRKLGRSMASIKWPIFVGLFIMGIVISIIFSTG